MAAQDVLERSRVEHLALEEARDAIMILRAPHLERDGRQMLRGDRANLPVSSTLDGSKLPG